MPTRHESAAALSPSPLGALGAALRQSLRQGYGPRDFRADLGAGLVVGIVALPLSMALAIASGVPPQHGLYTAIVAGALIALLGGSRVQVSGPTAAFVVVLAPIAAKFGLGGLLVAGMLAGFMLLAMGALRFGALIQFIPYPVTCGFTAGIAVVIATLQVKDLLGLEIAEMPEHFLEKVAALAQATPQARWPDLTIGTLTLITLLAWSRWTKRVPAALAALAIGAALAALLTHLVPGFEVATIRSRFSFTAAGATHAGIPQMPPMFALPWMLPGPDGQPLGFSLDLARDLLLAAFAIAVLGAIESLLSAVVADGITGHRHDPDAELMAQGIGNIVAPLFGGIAATGAIARTAANIRSGARSPVAAVIHALFVLLSVLLLAPLLGHLPMASLAALLLIVAWNMSEAKHALHVLRVAPKSDAAVLLTCFGLTVVFDMVVAVSVGVVLASILFMRRMAEVSGVRLVGEGHPDIHASLPPGVMLYEINGPMFFGATHKAMSALGRVQQGIHTVMLDVRSVPAMDATGLVNLESALDRARRAGLFVILAGVQPQPRHVLERAGLHDEGGHFAICHTFHEAVQLVRHRTQPPPG